MLRSSVLRKFNRASRAGLFALGLGAGLLAQAAAAAPGDQAFLSAYDAFRAGNPLKLARSAAGLHDHVLKPYTEYWRLVLQLEERAPEDVQAYFAQYPGSYTAERLRAEWLKVLGKRRDWQRFDAELIPLVREDLEIRCYAALSGLARGEAAALVRAHKAWLEPVELPPGCRAMADEMARSGALGVNDVWQRVRLLFAVNQTSAAKEALGYLPRNEQPDEGQLALAARQPERVLAHVPRAPERRSVREVLLLAGLRHARQEPEEVASALEGRLGAALHPEERAYLWGQVAHRAALRHDDQALDWYAKAGAELSDEQLAWKARAALRRGDWGAVKQAIDSMSAETHRDSAWNYWYGRALAALGNAEGARAYYLRISGQTDFYGLLALEELGYLPTLPAALYQPGEEEVAAAAKIDGLARALELFRLGLRTEGVREWIFSIRALDDRNLLAAAELARRAELYDRAIATADRTSALHNFALRYLAPYREVFSEYARSHGVEEALVLGIARQESRFIASARSVAGAQGLMQLMPATANWVARKIGLRDYHPGRVMDIKTNVTLGTRYLKLVLESLGHPLLASAAYNAGPGRARRWRDGRQLEGAIYAETIPFNETRDYVKKVMANSAFYGALLEGKPVSMKQRLGLIGAKDQGERPEQLP